jgi:hypothetical protein
MVELDGGAPPGPARVTYAELVPRIRTGLRLVLESSCDSEEKAGSEASVSL